MGDGTFIRDSQADRSCRVAAKRGRKRKVERMLPLGPAEDGTERLLKLPRLVEIRQRVLEKAAARSSAQPNIG